MKPAYIALIVVISIVFLVVLVSIGLREKFMAGTPAREAPQGRGPHRPPHPKFYKDIPEDHPDAIGLRKEMEVQMAETPKFTKDGYLLTQMPPGLHEKLLAAVRSTDRIPEGPASIFPRSSLGLPPYLVPIGQELRREVQDAVRPILEEWSGVSGLVHKSSYGPREYRRGSSLRMHVDIGETHIISAILQIDREGMDKDWPLVIIDREGKKQNIYLRGGEMLLYESASLPHSREVPLEGDYFVNMFIHFAPPNYKKLKEDFKNSLKK